MRHAFRQILVFPGDLVSFVWKKFIFAPQHFAVKINNVILFLISKNGIFILIYLDHLVSAEIKENAQFAYITLGPFNKLWYGRGKKYIMSF